MPAAPESSGLRGVNVTLKRFDAELTDRLVRRLVELGFRRVRLELDWYEPAPRAALDAFVDRCLEHDVQVLGLVTGLVPGTLRNLAGHRRYRRPQVETPAFLEFLAGQVRHFKGRVAEWEIWNEQNTRRFWIDAPSAAAYAELFRAAVATIRELDDAVGIIPGSLCGNDIDWLAPGIPRGYLAELAEAGGLEGATAIGFHPYAARCYVWPGSAEAIESAVVARVDRFLERYRALDRPIQITEIGLSRTWLRPGPAALAGVLERWLQRFTAQGLPTYLWCLTDFDDAAYVPGNPETAFGLLTLDGEPNAVGRAFLELER